MIRLASLSDIDNIMDIIAETIKIMGTENNPQWDNEYPKRQHFIEDIQAETLYVFEFKEQIGGLICINTIEPSEYEPAAWHSDQMALVIHRMAVSPQFRKQGIGSALLRFADELAIKTDMPYIKTDTFSNNTNMNRLFQKNGYEKVGEIRLRGLNKAFYCYDKLLS